MAAKKSTISIARSILALSGIMTLLVLAVANLAAQDKSPSDSAATICTAQKQIKAVAHLYFADKDNVFLIAEERVLFQAEDPIIYSKSIIEALISGPAQKLGPAIPQKTSLRALYISEEGTCYVDLSADIQEDHPGGAATELLTVYSIVNSLILNITDIETVKILIEGQESITLVGHIDLQQPLKANMLLIR